MDSADQVWIPPCLLLSGCFTSHPWHAAAWKRTLQPATPAAAHPHGDDLILALPLPAVDAGAHELWDRWPKEETGGIAMPCGGCAGEGACCLDDAQQPPAALATAQPSSPPPHAPSPGPACSGQ